MPRRCSVCDHVDRERIDEELVMGGSSLRGIAKRYGVSKDAAFRHRHQHVSRALVRLAERREEAGPATALERLEDLYERGRRVLDAAEQDGSASLTLASLRELRAVVVDLARITGELDERPTTVVNVIGSEEWLAIRSAISRALEQHPEARVAVAQELRALKAGT